MKRALFALTMLGCTPAELTQAQRATDARTYACSYIEHSSNPALYKAKEVCKTSADVQQVLAATAGKEACTAAYPKE
jgi:hypothetical protein